VVPVGTCGITVFGRVLYTCLRILYMSSHSARFCIETMNARVSCIMSIFCGCASAIHKCALPFVVLSLLFAGHGMPRDSPSTIV